MPSTYLIFGYGIPKDILKDENYNFYLKMVFNNIYSLETKNKEQKPLIICSGGNTDIIKPYKRTEGQEMIKFFKNLIKKPHLKKITKDWRFISEKKSLSTLENFLNCQKIIKDKKLTKNKIYIFCEKTRESRIRKVAKKIFNKKYKIKIIDIDFDVSSNRYLDPKFLDKKEQQILKYNLWALKSTKNLKTYQKLFKEKIEFLRKTDTKKHPEAVKEWWLKKLKELQI